MKQKAFSIIEIIFTLAIISIILVVALPKIDNILNSSKITQAKTTISLIREGITKEKNKLLLSNSLENLDSLDEGDENLFSKVLDTPIFEKTNWQRVETNSYKVSINETQSVIFTYDSTNYSFDCDYKEPLCKELTH